MQTKSHRLELDRRKLIAGAATLAAGAALIPRHLRAQSSAHKFKVGEAEITVLSDGSMAMPLDWVLPDRDRAAVAAVFQETGLTLGNLSLQVNVTLIKLGQNLILVDAGGGPDFAPARGKLPDNLDKAGIKPEAITHVVFTHAHPDHLWGLVDPLDGGSMFPKARHLMGGVERDYWLKPGIESSVPEDARGTAIGTQRRLKELGGRIETFKAGDEILPGLTAIDSAGHTPGHVSFRLQSGNGRLLIGGDALVEPVISFARPDWRWRPDWNQDMAIASRKRLLDMLVTDNTPLLGYHLPWPGLGRVERRGTAYRFIIAA